MTFGGIINMNSNKYLEEYYNGYDEDWRLQVKHGQIEYITTMHYIHQYLTGDKENVHDHNQDQEQFSTQVVNKGSERILEVGAGTGRYSISLAHEGYPVDAVELVKHNLDILKSKITKQDSIHAIQGNAKAHGSL